MSDKLTRVQVIHAHTIESEESLAEYVNLVQRVKDISKVRDLLRSINSIENKYFDIDNIISHVHIHLT